MEDLAKAAPLFPVEQSPGCPVLRGGPGHGLQSQFCEGLRNTTHPEVASKSMHRDQAVCLGGQDPAPSPRRTMLPAEPQESTNHTHFHLPRQSTPHCTLSPMEVPILASGNNHTRLAWQREGRVKGRGMKVNLAEREPWGRLQGVWIQKGRGRPKWPDERRPRAGRFGFEKRCVGETGTQGHTGGPMGGKEMGGSLPRERTGHGTRKLEPKAVMLCTSGQLPKQGKMTTKMFIVAPFIKTKNTEATCVSQGSSENRNNRR